LVLVWQTVGFHGKEWSAAEVAWRGAERIQVSKQFLFDQRVISHLVCEEYFKLKQSRLCLAENQFFYETTFDLLRVL